MARIPIEPKPARSFLLPLLAVLVLGLVGFLLMRGCADDPTGPDATTSDAATAADSTLADPGAMGGELTRLADFTAADLRALVGRPVRLTDVTPSRVAGDSTFTVQGDSGQHVLVVLQGLGEGDAGSPDGRYTVRAGQSLSLTGTVVAYPPADTVVLSVEDRAAARAQGVYLRARRVGGPDVVRNGSSLSP